MKEPKIYLQVFELIGLHRNENKRLKLPLGTKRKKRHAQEPQHH